MIRLLPALLAGAVLATPVAADEVADTLESALKSYRDGDVTAARQDIDYATKLLDSMKAEALAKFLPAALPGWTRSDQDNAQAGGMMAMLGGGTTVSATYTKGDGTDLTINLVADSPMLGGLASALGGIAAMGGGKPMRIQRVEFVDSDGEVQGMVGGKVMVQVSGAASVEDKTAYIGAMDLGKLADF